MLTSVEVQTNDLLHFSGKFSRTKDNVSYDNGQQKKGVTRNPTRYAGWDVKVSEFARLTHNPIRAIVEGLKIVPNPEKQMIALSIGKFTLLLLLNIIIIIITL